ncbi:MAG: hypothetical protein GY847_30070, partial [Proteobacteria bacterium]|nr:hypothetical protein [Pseudomonadota bacterium]
TEESTVAIDWNDNQPIIELIRSSPEPAQVPSVPLPNALRAISSPAPTENEHRLAPMNRLNEPNTVSRVHAEPSSIARYRIAPFHPLERLEDVPPIIDAAPQTSLVMDNHSPLYHAFGYSVTQLTATSARLVFPLVPECRFRSHRIARLTHCSELDGIPMHFPLNTIFQLGDLLMLWTCYEFEYNYPLITSFVVHNSATFRL